MATLTADVTGRGPRRGDTRHFSQVINGKQAAAAGNGVSRPHGRRQQEGRVRATPVQQGGYMWGWRGREGGHADVTHVPDFDTQDVLTDTLTR